MILQTTSFIIIFFVIFWCLCNSRKVSGTFLQLLFLKYACDNLLNRALVKTTSDFASKFSLWFFFIKGWGKYNCYVYCTSFFHLERSCRPMSFFSNSMGIFFNMPAIIIPSKNLPADSARVSWTPLQSFLSWKYLLI